MSKKPEEFEQVKITNGWFRSAGNHFGWVDTGHSMEGVGVHYDILKRNLDTSIHLIVNDDLYTLVVDDAKQFLNNHKSWQQISGQWVGVVPKSLLKKDNVKELPFDEVSKLKA